MTKPKQVHKDTCELCGKPIKEHTIILVKKGGSNVIRLEKLHRDGIRNYR